MSEEENMAGEEIDASEVDIVDLLNLFAEIAEKMEESGGQMLVFSPLLKEAANEIAYLRTMAVEDITVCGKDGEILIQVTSDDIPAVLHEAVQMWVDAALAKAIEDGDIIEEDEEGE